MSLSQFDLIIIGSGAAGYSAATRAVHLGARRVAVVERGPLFGTCVNVGCVPSKFLIGVGDLYRYGNYGHEGLTVHSTLNLPAVIREKDTLLSRLREKKRHYLFDELAVELIEGVAVFLSPHEISVDGHRYSGKQFVIAAGSSPAVPPVEGIGKVAYMTNVEALGLTDPPESLVVVGGRALGLEFAQLFSHFGSRVTLLQRSRRLIPEEEEVISDLMKEYLSAEGITVVTGAELVRVWQDEGSVSISAVSDGQGASYQASALLMATGRVPNTRELHPEAAGVKTGPKGEVIVGRDLRTTAPHIWAAGDVLGEPQLEKTAGIGGSIAAENAISGSGRELDLSALPHAVFTTPQVASVGITEREAHTRGLAVKCRSIRMDRMARSLISGDSRGTVKIVAAADQEEILGVHICAPLAAEMVQEGVNAVRHRFTVQDLIDTFHVFPTATEALQVCAREFRKGSAKESCCT
jgi:mercuric reductase